MSQPHAADTLPEPGAPARPSRGAGAFVWVLALLAAALAIGWQNTPEPTQRRLLGLPPAEAGQAAPLDVADPVAMQLKLYLQLGRTFERWQGGSEAQFDASAETILEHTPLTPGQAVAAAVYEAERGRVSEALERLDALEADLESVAPEGEGGADTGRARAVRLQNEAITDLVRHDIPALRALLAEGPDALTPEQRDRIAAHYRYFGRLALARTLDPDHPQRRALFSDAAVWRVLFLVAFAVGAVLAAVGGLVLLIVFLSGLAGRPRRPRPRRPATSNGALVETFALFAACFVVVAVASTWAEHRWPKLAVLQIPLQWSLLLVPFWPLLRGWRWGQWRQAVGVHAGRGVAREIGAGVLGYLACVPLFIAGTIVTLLVLIAEEMLLGPPPAPPDNPVIDLLLGADPVIVLLVASLACIWAPLCEELVFRGSLFGHLWANAHWAWGAVLSAFLFAYMHAYGPLLLAPIIALGLGFAVIRWWRGSLIACITAHAIHNTTLITVLVIVLPLFPA